MLTRKDDPIISNYITCFTEVLTLVMYSDVHITQHNDEDPGKEHITAEFISSWIDSCKIILSYHSQQGEEWKTLAYFDWYIQDLNISRDNFLCILFCNYTIPFLIEENAELIWNSCLWEWVAIKPSLSS